MDKKQKKIRILALCDSPTSPTGFAQVSLNILNGLAATGKYEIDVVGINFRGDAYSHEKFPYNIFPAQPQGYSDMYGRGRVLQALNGHEMQAGLMPSWDIVFTIQDSFIIEGYGIDTRFGEYLRIMSEYWKRIVDPEAWFKWIGYFPVDSDLKENWVTRAIALPHFPVAYCNFGKKEILKFEKDVFKVLFNFQMEDAFVKKEAIINVDSLKNRLTIIPHGVDLKVFKPLPNEEIKKFRKAFFQGKVKDDTFLVINISRNQPRKDLARTMAVFAELKKKIPNSYLYLHCQAEDAGGNLHEMARNFNLRPVEDYALPNDFSAGHGYPVEKVNQIYNAADVCITTTLGEGWGFLTTEAMATKTPIIAPNITSILDIFDSYNDKDPEKSGILPPPLTSEKLRGIPVKAGSNSSEWTCLGVSDNERVRPLTNVDDMVEKLVWVHDNKKAVKKIVERAYAWVQGLSWDNIVKEWDALFMKAYHELEREREVAKSFDKAGRNDPCPCGSGKKFKKCHGAKARKERVADWLKNNDNDKSKV